MKKTFSLRVEEIHDEDGGAARIADLTDGKEAGVFFRVQSWDDHGNHQEFDNLGLKQGQQVEITLSVPDQ